MATRRVRSGSICGVIAASGLFSTFASVTGDEIKTAEGNQAAASSVSNRKAHPLAPIFKTTEAIVIFEAKNPPRYTVQPGRDFPGQKRPVEEEKKLTVVCELLMKVKPEPAERLEYFSWMKQPDYPIRFRSWGCILREAKPIPGGWTVKLQAMARATDLTAYPYDVYNRYIEEYELSESGQIRFVRGYPHPDDRDGRPNFRRFGGI
jgi:hypothetical protein